MVIVAENRRLCSRSHNSLKLAIVQGVLFKVYQVLAQPRYRMRGAPQSAPAANEVEAQWICKLRTIVPCIRNVVCDANVDSPATL